LVLRSLDCGRFFSSNPLKYNDNPKTLRSGAVGFCGRPQQAKNPTAPIFENLHFIVCFQRLIQNRTRPHFFAFSAVAHNFANPLKTNADFESVKSSAVA